MQTGQKNDSRRGKRAVKYMPHLDGIRAFAAIGVIVEHWAGGFRPLFHQLVQSLDLGGWGVECFFVLSGFLITLILLDIKGQNLPFATGLGRFYARRALRIFPAYYGTLLIGVFLSSDMRSVIAWHALYITDLFPIWHNTWPSAGGHFWSLAVEEQFYLFWPLIVLAFPTRIVMRTALGLCILAPLSRLLIAHAVGHEEIIIYTFPTTALDLLGFGAFLACVRHEGRLSAHDVFTKRLRIVGLVALLCYLALYFQIRSTLLFAVIDRTLLALFFGAIVAVAANGHTGVPGWLLGNRLIVWLGTVSYGLYIFHPFILPMYVSLRVFFGLTEDEFGAFYVRYPLLIILLLFVTATSYYALERPIRSFRKNFS